MNDKKNNIPKGISVTYFNDESKNIHAEAPIDKEQAKRLSKRIYKDAMTELSTNGKDNKPEQSSRS